MSATTVRRSFAPGETAAIEDRLKLLIPHDVVSVRPIALDKKAAYIDGATAFSLADELFGADNWDFKVISTSIDEIVQNASKNFDVSASAIARITLVDGTHHEDIGIGSYKNGSNVNNAKDAAVGNAVVDALKRSLRWFGNAAGNCLYDNAYLGKMEETSPSDGAYFQPVRAGYRRESLASEARAILVSKRPTGFPLTQIQSRNVLQRSRSKEGAGSQTAGGYIGPAQSSRSLLNPCRTPYSSGDSVRKTLSKD